MRALITGITGQDGAYLAEFLLSKGYEVYGLKRRSSTPNLWRLDALGITEDVILVDGDMTDTPSLRGALELAVPHEVYNLAAQSFVQSSFDTPVNTFDVNAKGVISLLESIRLMDKSIKFYQASTSEMFGLVDAEAQSEKTRFYPRSPYAVAKVAAHYATINYREAYGLHTSCGILFNHESPLRGEEFVTQKICTAVKKILRGEQSELYLGNMESERDWGHARDYVEAMWLMLQSEPDEYVVATGESYSVREFADMAFSYHGLDYRDYIHYDERFKRPSDVPVLRGNPSKIIGKLGWMPKHDIQSLVKDMVL